MFDVLLQNLQLISILICAFLGAFGINVLLGIYYNLSAIKESFSREKLITGLIRGGIILVSGLAITVIISLLPEILSSFGINADSGLFENISVVAMAGVLASTIVRYLSDALKKFYAILSYHSEETPHSEEE